MIFLTGGTGHMGSPLLTQLQHRGAQARVLTHSAAGRGRVEDAGFDVIDADLRDPDGLATAMAGCDHLFLLTPPRPDQVTREKAVIDAARAAGVGHVVAVSIIAADTRSSINFSRWHAEIDQHLRNSGMGYTLLRPAGFMHVHLWPMSTIKTEGRWYGMSGDGATAYIDAEDVAAVAAEVLTSSGHQGATYELTGPAALSMPEAAAILGEVLDLPVEYVDVPPDRYREQLSRAGVPQFVIDGFVAFYEAVRAGHAATVSNSVQELIGRPARDYREFAKAHKDRGSSS